MSASIVTWSRLEPVDQTSDLRVPLAAPIADPLWLLHRQWQLGELDGNDAGTPIAVTVSHQAVPLSRYWAGGPVASDYSPAARPLEPVVEAERVRGLDAQHRRLAAETGAHFLRLLRAAGGIALVPQFIDRFAVSLDRSPDPIADPLGAEAAVLLDGRAIDGDALAAALAIHRRADGRLTGLPASFPGDPAVVLPVAERWLAWYDELLVEPAAGPDASAAPEAWDARRFEYRFAAAAGEGAGRATFIASSFDDGHLDWPDLDVDASIDLGAPGASGGPVTGGEVAIPVPLTYPGMPAHRHWEIEDSRVNFAGVQAASTDIVRMLLTDFALVYGEDWFLLPLTVPVGSVVTITSMKVRDTFGITSTVAPTVPASGDGVGHLWSMYRTTAVSGEPLGLDTLFVPPTLGATTAGPPLEEVAFARDEMANVVWAVERTTASPLGTPVDRYRNSQPRIPQVALDVTTDIGDAELIYRLLTPMPGNWYPYLPRRTASGDDIVLERLPASTPLGAIARESTVVEDEEVTRGGIVVQRAWQFARWTNGQPLLWLGRHVHAGRGEVSSGLAWDTTEERN